jgi:HlyD family secretion protein
MDSELSRLKIDRSQRRGNGNARWSRVWILGGVLLFVLLAVARLVYPRFDSGTEVSIQRVIASSAAEAEPGIILNATGYIVAAHKIQVASKVIGRVAWIGVDKGDRVTKGQVICRLEDDEFRAQLKQGEGQLLSLEAKLQELLNGSRPEEVALAEANVAQSKAELENARISLNRAKELVAQQVSSQQVLDDAQARYDAQVARVASLDRAYDLVRIGPRKEQIAAMQGQILEVRGRVEYYKSQLDNTVIKAPVTGTILERAVEPGEFVTTMFVGERGAKGFVCTMADLNDLQVELDINQNDFAKLGPRQRGVITTDAYPDRKYSGYIKEISPEANRQKATVQVKVQVEQPDDHLRPEMNASVAFQEERAPRGRPQAKEESDGAPARVVTVPKTAVRGDSVFVFVDGKAVQRPLRLGPSMGASVRVEQGLNGGEDVILDPPPTLKTGDKVKVRKG